MARPYRRTRYYNYPNLRTNMNQTPAAPEEVASAQALDTEPELVATAEREDTYDDDDDDRRKDNSTCRVRFFNAAAGYGNLEVVVGGKMISNSLPFGIATDYENIPDGFQQVTITMVQDPEAVLLNKRLPFRNCMNTTAAIINTSTGIEIMMINDTGCRIGEEDRACFRVANLSYSSPSLDVVLENGNPVFEDVRFKYVTEYKQAVLGEYNFNVMVARSAETVKNNTVDLIMPEKPVDEGGYPAETENAYTYFFEDLEDGDRYTAYIIGNKDYDPPLRVETLEEEDD